MTTRLFRTLALVFAPVVLAAPAAGQDVNDASEKAMKAAAAKVAPSVVKIETAGGAEVIGGPKGVRKGLGPTTGLVVGADGFVISSSFNFAHKPAEIFVTVPGRPARLVAKVVANDQTRMLTLLKVDAKDLPVPAAFPKKDMQIGQWALALGRALDPNADHPPSMSAGIVSATNRIVGKMIQTDAKISPTNYGGPLVSIDGRVLGVLVPATPRGEGDTAGVEWYDSGIGFAVPFEDVLAKVPQLKEGKDLRRGLLGINPQAPDLYNTEPVIGAVQPDSAAARAGLEVGDKIVSLDGKPTPNYSVIQHVLGPKYEGDTVTIKVRRGDKELEFKDVKLLGTATAFVNAFLGVLPLRDDPTPGVGVRYVYPGSPADKAGIKAGDRITKFGPAKSKTLPPVANKAALAAALSRMSPGTEVSVEVKRKDGDKTETVNATLATVPDTVPEKLPPASAGEKPAEPKKDGEPKKEVAPPPKKGGEQPVSFVQDPFAKKKGPEKVETGYRVRVNEALGREYWLYVPDGYDAKSSYGLIVWFHAAAQGGKDGERMARVFKEFCEDAHFVVMGPKAQNPEGWVPSETEAVMQDVRAVLAEYKIDRTRVVAHGMGVGGQMAYYLGFNARDVFRGVAVVGATLGTAPKENVANQPLAFFVAAGEKDPLLKEVAASKALLDEKRFPVVYREMPGVGKDYMDPKTFGQLLNWLDSLDRL